MIFRGLLTSRVTEWCAFCLFCSWFPQKPQFFLSLLLSSIQVIYCCITNHPKFSGIKPPPLFDTCGFCASGIWKKHRGDGSSLLHGVWGLSWDESTAGGHHNEGYCLYFKDQSSYTYLVPGLEWLSCNCQPEQLHVASLEWLVLLPALLLGSKSGIPKRASRE